MKAQMKRVQIQGQKYDLPEQEVRIQKLIAKGISLNDRIKELESDLESVKAELTDIARARRGDSTTVSVKAISGESAIITFRESYEADDRVNEIAHALGSLFDRFFEKKPESWKTTKELKEFLDGKNTYGLENPDSVKGFIMPHIRKKEVKPNVKFDIERRDR